MGSKGVWRSVVAAAGLMLAWGIAPGCSPSVAGYCNKVCECRGCDDEQRTGCIDDVKDSQKQAGDAGCANEWSEYFSCLNAETMCTNGQVDADGCETERDKLAACGGGFSSGCYSLCEKGKQCEGSDPSTDCQKACDDTIDLFEESGCLPFYEDYLTCIDAADSICTGGGDECNEQANAYVECIIKFCDQNPNTKLCGGGSSSGAGGASSGEGGAGGSF